MGVSSFTYEYIEKYSNSSTKNCQARKAEICVEAPSGSADSCLIKTWSPGIDGSQ